MRLLRQLGSEKVHLLYGGRERMYPTFAAIVRRLTDPAIPIHCIRGRSPSWKWANTDLAVLDWYRHAGRGVAFHSVAVIDWDLVPYASIAEIYADVPDNAVGLTGLVPLAEREAVWPWIQHPAYRSEWEDLQAHLRVAHGWDDEPMLCIGPGFVLAKTFLDAYAAADIPDLCHDELRLPAFAQALGFQLHDTRLYRSWTDPAEQAIFNADRLTVRPAVMRAELAAPGGRRVFHPYRGIVPTGGLPGTPGTAVHPRWTGRDRALRILSRTATGLLFPGRRLRTLTGRFRSRVLGRRSWPAVPRDERLNAWHE